MEAIHKLKVYCPYEILKIEDIKISCKPNEHGYLYLRCLIDDSIKFKYSIEASTEDKIILYEELEGNKRSILFTGIIESVRTTNENEVYYLEIEAASSSSILDKQEKTRSFQDSQMSYDDLIKEVLKSYKDISLGFTQCMNRPMSIGKPLFQYKETDYEFLKRVASLLGLDLVCDIIKYGNAFYFGRPQGLKYELDDNINYKACKDLERYHKAVTRGFDVDFHDTDFFYYEIESLQNMEIGDGIYFKQKDLYVNQFEAELNKGELIYTYRFCRKNGIWQDKIYNEKIKGKALEGEVLETKGEKLKLHLYVDESQDPSKAEWFYYAPPTGNILYSMPIVGETATLYFQDEVDSNPIVTNCVRKNGSTCEQMSDTTNRYFATESGDYLDVLPGAINIHRNGLNVDFIDGCGVTFSSSGNLSLSGGSVNLSGGSVSINATSQIKVQKGSGSYISLESEFYAQASEVYENGSTRDSYAAFTDDDPTAGVAEALAKKKQQQLEQAAFKDQQLMEAMQGSEAKAKGGSSSDEENSNNDGTSKESNNNGGFFNTVKNNLISDWKGLDAGLTEFSEECQEGFDFIGEKLGIDYDKPQPDSGKTLREIAEDRKEETNNYINELREEAPNKEEFDIVKGTAKLAADAISYVEAGYGAINIAKSGVNAVREVAGGLKSGGNVSGIIEDVSNYVKNLFKGTESEESVNIGNTSDDIANSSKDVENTSGNIETSPDNVEDTSESTENTSKVDTNENYVYEDTAKPENTTSYTDTNEPQEVIDSPVDGEGSGDNEGVSNPDLHFESWEDFSKYTQEIGKDSSLTTKEKISKIQEAYENVVDKTDINIPIDSQYVKGFDANGNAIYDWPKYLGFDESSITSITRENCLPENWDRYGYMGGSNFASVPETAPYTYSERSIPYVENEAAYHSGTFSNATYFDKIDAIKSGDLDALNNILESEGISKVDATYFENLCETYNDFIEDTAQAVGSDINATYGLKGTAAAWGDLVGGAEQIVTPFNGNILQKLGILTV